MALVKENRYQYSSLKGRERRSSLPDPKSEFRRRCNKNWITVVMIIVVMHYMYTYFWLTKELEDSTVGLRGRGDEYLTTKSPVKNNIEPRRMAVTRKDDFMRYYILNTTYMTRVRQSRLPRCIIKNQTGPYNLHKDSVDSSTIENVYPMVQKGGYYQPLNCSARDKVAVIVAYREREENLRIFLYNIHPFLMAQQLEYQIFIIEQAGDGLFNKGRIYNAGFKEINKLNKFQCMVFHDLDLLPMNMDILYSCPTLPRHMSSNIVPRRDTDRRYDFKSLFGGVVSLTTEMMVRANGYSNVYFGWGGEDSDIFWRLRAAGYPVVRYNITIGKFSVLPHERAPPNRFRYHLLGRAVERYKIDGLSNIEYTVISNSSYHLYTHILVDINPRNENVTVLTEKWLKNDA